MLLLALLLSCASSPADETTGSTSPPTPLPVPHPAPVTTPPEPTTPEPTTPVLPPLEASLERADDDVYLAWVLTVEGAEGPLEIHLDGLDGTERTWEAASPVALLGLHADTDYRVQVTDGERSIERRFRTLPLPEPFPILEALTHDPARVSPGHTLVPASHPEHGLLIVLDESLEPVWISHSTSPWYAAEWAEDRFVGIRGHKLRSVELLGDRWMADNPRRLHHDAAAVPDGYVALSEELAEVDAFPVSYEAPDERAPATIRDHVLVSFDPKGAELSALPLSSVLEPARCSYDCLKVDSGGFDWVHANTVVPMGDGRYLVSSRAQKALFTTTLDGELGWILSNPHGWSEPWASARLQPIGDIVWPEDQHAPHWDPTTGRLTLFDNGGRRYTPYEEPTAESGQYSRLVSYQIDEGAGTVEEVWSWQPEPPVFAAIMGDADPVANGNVLSVFTWLSESDGIPNAELGWGQRASRVIEVDPATDQPVLDLRLRSDADELAEGWWTFRVQRIPPITELLAPSAP